MSSSIPDPDGAVDLDGEDPDQDDGVDASGATKPNQATKLVDLALGKYGLGVTPDGRPFAFDEMTPHVVFDLKGNKLGLRQQISSDYYDKYNGAPSQTALASAMNVLEGKALKCPPTPVHLRVAGNRDAVYVDMADNDNRLIKISGGEWKVVHSSPYRFRRTENTAAMREPTPGGKLSTLFSYLHVRPEDRTLLVGILVDALINPNTAKPITHFEGEHGTSKTTTTVHFASLVDPTVVPHHGPPSDLKHWTSVAGASWMVALDNLSSVPDWLSDAFCRTATGTGLAKRSLYTDDDLSIAVFRRAIVFNGISMSSLRGDLADRMVSFELRRITDQQRKSEEDLQRDWEADLPSILGGLLRLAAKVHAMLPRLEPQPLPRMADFARVLLCIDKLAKQPNAMAEYRARQARNLSESVVDDPFIGHLVDTRYTTAPGGEPANDILRRATACLKVEPKPKSWPVSPKSVSSRLKRNAPGLRSLGWTVEDDGARNETHTKRWTLHPPEQTPNQPGGSTT